MEISRQDAFRKLREPCVELSSIGLKYRGRQVSPNDVFIVLRSVHAALNELASKNALDAKLAEYAFFPLAHIFNEVKRTPANILELAVKCLQILIAEGWRTNLSPQMGKQLIILLTLIVGGAPSKEGNRATHVPAAELNIAGFNCLSAIFNVLKGSVAESTIYHEIGTATVVDQTVYVLLESITDDNVDEFCISAARALQALYHRIADRVVLASIMPRTVSALTKVLKPTTQIRRSYKLICICLSILNEILRTVLNDLVNTGLPEKASQPQNADERLVLDGSWLQATTAQIKIALTNVIQLRRHERQEVQDELLKLCLMVVEDCRNTLQDSVPILIETVVVLSEVDESQMPNGAYISLRHLATTYAIVSDSLKSSVHSWLTSFTRTMQSNDETKKQWALKQISTAFQVLSEIQAGSDILTRNLTSGLCDSVSVIVNHTSNALQPLNSGSLDDQALDVLHPGGNSVSFPAVLLDHRSEQRTLKDLQTMITRLNLSESGSDMTRMIMDRVHQEQGNSVIAPLWLAINFLKSSSQVTNTFDEFIALDFLEPSSSYSTKADMIEELYYISLPILDESLSDGSRDWRVLALALEVVALQAEQLKEAFRPELMEALYPVLQLLASNNSSLREHAMTCLNILTKACNYRDTSSMIIENVDYLVNSVGLKLNTFDVSPYPPQVLLMMVKLCGARLVPYLDDLVDSIFGILDLYHGYPKLVEMMFKTLAAIVEESTKKTSFLKIEPTKDSKPIDHFKRAYRRLQISNLAEDFANQKIKRTTYSADDLGENVSHLKRPWSEDLNEKGKDTEDSGNALQDLLNGEESDEPLPTPNEPEDESPLSKPHSILIHIVKSIPPHLSSPSPHLRRSLLCILVDVFPALGANENSFLPLINDLWPSIAARISFPSSLGGPPASMTLIGKDMSNTMNYQSKEAAYDIDFQEETFVTTTACKALEIIFQNAGDFMASRVESEFPRWERLYGRAWERVREDADKVIERRSQQEGKGIFNNDSNRTLSLEFVQSLSIMKPGSASGSRAFTPHHNLWRAFASLFLTLLTHVRLPLSVGDRICEMLGEWIARYAGPTYYFSRPCLVGYSGEERHRDPVSISSEVESIEATIQAMETWNPDLTWFIFNQQKKQIFNVVAKEMTSKPLASRSFVGGRLRFAEVVF